MSIRYLFQKLIKSAIKSILALVLLFLSFQIISAIYIQEGLLETIFANPLDNAEKIQIATTAKTITFEETSPKIEKELKVNLGVYKEKNLKIYAKSKKGKRVQLEYLKNGNELTINDTSILLPGLNTLEIQEGNKIIFTKEFEWGVLVINTFIREHKVGDKADFQISVLDELGEMVCNADVKLEIISPTQKVSLNSTENGLIKATDYCNKKELTLIPDYETEYLLEEFGEYTLNLSAVTKNGEKKISQKLVVKESLDFEIFRNTATRIYPLLIYPSQIKVKANRDFNGILVETIPSTFEIKSLSKDNLKVINDGKDQIITWKIDIKKGEEKSFFYEYDAPDESPYHYQLGKSSLENSDFKYTESLEWDIAVDSVGYAFATRLWSAGFELNTTTAEVEYTANIGTTPSISNSTYRSGAYALNTNISSGTSGVRYSFTAAADTATATYFRSYIRITTLPSSTIQVMCMRDNAGTYQSCLRLTSGGLLQLFNEEDNAQVGSNSSALSTGTWYRLEMEFDFGTAGTGNSKMSARINGASFASSTTQNLANGITFIDIGVLQTETANFFWDDLAINQDAFASQYNWPNSGQIVHLRPNGDGTNVAWTGNPTNGANEYQNVDDVTPDDTSTRIACTANAQLQDFTHEDTSTYSIGVSDTIKLAEAWLRTGDAATTTSRSHSQSILNAGGGIDTSATNALVVTGYYTDDDTMPRNASIISYDDPGATNYGKLTPAIVDGMTTRINAVDCSPVYSVTAVWLLIEYDTAEGGRVYSSGFELQSVTADMEFTTINGTPTITTATKRSGEAALQVASLGSGTREAVNFQFVTANANGPYFLRAYLYITTAPSAENSIIDFRNSAGTIIARITLDNSRQLQLRDEDGTIGSVSSALSTTTWYRIELKVDASGGASADTVEGLLNGSSFGTSSTRDLSTGVYQFGVGGNLNAEAQTTGDWLFDDLALNENVGTTQNGYPGEGKIVHLQPNANGTNIAWTDTPNVADAVEYQNVDDITPDDISTYLAATAINALQDTAMEDSSTYSITASDAIKLVSPGVRARISAAATMAFSLEMMDGGTSGASMESNAILTTTTTWFTNVNTAPRVYPLTAYTKPAQETAWDTTSLDDLQLSIRETVDTGNSIQVSALWILVEYDPQLINIEGVCKAFDQTTDCGDTGTVKVAVGTTVQAQEQTTVAGTWTIFDVPKPTTGAIVTIYISGAGNSDEANAVTKYDGSGNITGVLLYKEHLTIGSDDNQTLTNADVGTYDNSVSSNEDIFFNVTFVPEVYNLVVDTLSQSTTEKLQILTSNNLTSGGTISTHDLDIRGTLNTASNNITITGSYNNSGTFTTTTSTVSMTSTTTETLSGTLSGSSKFYNLTFNGSEGAWSFTSNPAVEVANDLTITAGTLTSTSNASGLTVTGNYSNSGTFTHNSGTLIMNATDAGNTLAGTLSGSSSFYNLTFNGVGGAWSFTSNPAVEVANDLTITAGTLTSTSHVSGLTITGNYSNSGTFTHNSGTVIFNATDAGNTIAGTLSGSSKFNNLTFNGIGGAWSFTSNPAVEVANDLTITAGTLTSTSHASGLTITGNYSNSGTFTHNSGTVIFNATDAGNTLAGTLSGTSGKFYNLTFNGSGGAWSFTSNPAVEVANDLTITVGTVTSTSGNLTITGNYSNSGTFTHNSGTVIFNATDAGNTIAGTLSGLSKFYNMTINGSGGAWSITSNPNIKVINDFTISAGTFTSTTGTLSIGGNYSNSGTFTHNSGTVLFNSYIASLNLSGNLSGSSSFYNLKFDRCPTLVSSVAYWSFDETTGTTTPDNCSNNYTGNLASGSNTPTWTTGKYGNGLSFDGNDYVNYGDVASMKNASALTVCAWVYPTALNDWNTVFAKDLDGTGTQRTYFQHSGSGYGGNDDVLIGIANGSNTYGYTDENLLAINTWGHWCLVYNGGGSTNADKLKFYFNGVERSLTFAGTIPSTTSNSTSDLIIGNGRIGSSNYFSGKIDQVIIYNTNLEARLVIEDKDRVEGDWSYNTNPNVTVLNDYTIANGNHTATSGFTTITGNYLNNGKFTHNSGTVTFNATDAGNTVAGTLSGTTGKFNNLTFNGSGGAWSFTSNPAVEIANNFTITLGTVTSTSGNLTVTGNYSNSGTFTNNSGTVIFNATDAGNTIAGTLSGSSKFNNLTFNGSGGAWSFTSNPAVEVANDLTITAGTLTSTSHASGLTITGNYSNSGTFTHNSGTVIMNATDAGNTLGGNLSSTSSFYNLTFSGAAGAWSFTSNPAVTVANNLSISDGTLTATSGTTTIGGNFTKTGGTFTHNSGTVVFYDNTKVSTLTYNADITFSSFTVSTTDKEMRFDNVDKTTISGTFTINGSACLTPVLLYSDSAGNQFDIDATGTVSINYAEIQDSNAITALTASNSVAGAGGNNTNWTINAGSCSSNTPPNNPSSLTQKTAGDVTITTGSWHNSTSIKFTATADDTDNPDTLYLCVEVDQLGTSFSNTEDTCGSGVAYSGTPVSLVVSVTVTDALEYHWQVRVKDTASTYSSWVSYGGNGETERDFGIDTTAPTGGTVYDGSGLGVDVSFNDGSLSSLSANWGSINSDVSGLLKYEYSIGTSQGATDIVGWTNNNTSTTVTVNSLTLQTSVMYFFNVRTTDNATNTSTIYSNGQLVAPSLSFALDSNSVTFLNLNNGNSFTDTKTSLLTTSTNAYNGYVIKAFVTDNLRSVQNPTKTIPHFTAGSYTNPSEWGGSDYGFGYTSSDTSIQGAGKFPSSGACLGSGTAPCYAPFATSGPGEIVADHTATVTGSPITNEQFTITYKVKTTNVQEAGKYSSTVVYTIVAQY